LIVQVAPTARLEPQLLEKTKGEASTPVREMLVMDSAEPPVLVRITESVPEDVPTVRLPNARLETESDATGGL
jgi:hypothetical protein